MLIINVLRQQNTINYFSHMQKIFLKNALILALSALAVIAFQAATLGGVKAENKKTAALEAKYMDMALKGGSADTKVDKLLEKYHTTINGLFNERIKIMVKAENQGTLSDLIKPPEFEKDKPSVRKPCIGKNQKPNVSTYCLAMLSTDEYFAFRKAMEYVKNLAISEVGGASSKTSDKEFRKYGSIINRIDDEISIGKQTLDQALAAYNEMQLALPLHKKYLEVIKTMELYRDAVADVRDEIEQFPAEFIDVTTPMCT